MRVIHRSGVFGFMFAAALVAPAGVWAQSRPVAVPIVGSPAAEQPQPPPAPAVPVPSQPPSLPPPIPPSLPPGAQASPNASPVPVTASGPRKLDLSFRDGTVALDAQNVTIREILTEWQQRDGCQFVNADKLPPNRFSMQLPAGTPALDAIDSLLRGLGTPTTGYGYIVAPPTGTLKGSVCGAVYIVPSSRPTMAAGFAPMPSSLVPQQPAMTSPDDEIPPVMPFPAPVFPQEPRQVPRPPGVPGPPGQPMPGGQPGQAGQPNQNPGNSTPAVQSPGFGPVAPTAPGAGRLGAPPPTQTPPNGGRGGA